MLATACRRGNLCTLFKSSQNTDSFIKDFLIKSSVLPILEKMTLYKFEIIRYVYFYNNYNLLWFLTFKKSVDILWGQKKQESVKVKDWTVPFKQIILISNSQKNNDRNTKLTHGGLEHNSNRPFYWYGDHIELIRFKEYYGMPRGHEQDPIYSLTIYALFGPIILYVFLETDCNGKKRSLCRVWL